MTFQITVLDFLYLSLTFGFIVLVYFVVHLIKRVEVTLTKLDPVLENVNDTTGDIRNLKDTAKRTFFTAASTVLGIFFGKKK